MAAICYSGPISAVPTNEQFLGEKRTGAKFQIGSLKTEGLVCINRRMLIIYVYILYGLRHFLLGVTNFVANKLN